MTIALSPDEFSGDGANFFICSPFRRASLRFERRFTGDVNLYYDRRKNRICENDGVEIPGNPGFPEKNGGSGAILYARDE